MIGTCKHCEHSRRRTQMNVTALFCCFNPPVFHLIPQPTGLAMGGFWPPVEEGERCSKFNPDPTQERGRRQSALSEMAP